MDHLATYNKIINKAISENRKKLQFDNANYVYYENHHIIPKCIGGTDEQDNLVLLTAREHFICHKLLTHIYKNNHKIYHAYHFMAFMNKRKYELSSRDYEYAIELFRQIPKDHQGEKNPMYGKKQSKQSIRKNRESNLGSYEEKFGVTKAIQMKEKIGKSVKGEKNGMHGKSFYDVWVESHGKEIADEKLENYKNNLRGRIWVKNIPLNKEKQINANEVEEYVKNGWEFGRFSQPNRKPFSEETRKKQSNIRKEYWKRKKQLL